MMQKEMMQSLYKYNDYANHLVLDVVERLTPDQLTQESSPSHGNVYALIQHMMGCELAFLKICQQQPIPQKGQEGVPQVREMRAFWKELSQERTSYLETLDEASLLEEVKFEFPGKSYHLPRWQLLMQAFLHSVHHRGELSIVLSTLGYPLPTLDIIIPFLQQSGQGWT